MPNRSNPPAEAERLELGIKVCLSNNDQRGLLNLVSEAKPVDVAAGAAELSDSELQAFVNALPSSRIAPLLRDSEDALQPRIAGMIDDRHLLTVLGHMPDDEVADVLSALPPARVGALLQQMREADRMVLESLLQYPDETAGSIMTTSFLSMQDNLTVEDGLSLLRSRGGKVEQIQNIYVMGQNSQLVGSLDLRKMLSSPRTVMISSIMDRDFISIDPYTDQEKAAELVARYNLNALPVVSSGRLLGVITVDDIIDVIIEEYDEDMLRLAGVSREETLESPLLSSVRMRLPWLMVNLATAFLASFVVSLFEGTIERVVALSAIMTIVSGMGGNAGSQTMAIVVRHLARERVSLGDTLRSLGKEMMAGIINGAAIGIVTGAVVAAKYHNPYLSLIVLAAMVGNMVIAGSSGLLVPVVLKACHQDPAVSSSIFVTTATDVLGFLLFLGLADLFLPVLV